MIQNCEAMKVGRLIFDGRLRPSFDEQKFLDGVVGGSQHSSLLDEAKSWVASSENDEETFIRDFGEDEYQWFQGFQYGIAEVMCTIVWACQDIEIERRGHFQTAAPKPIGIDLIVPDDAPILFDLNTFDPPTPAEFRAVIERLGLTKAAAAAKIGANERHIRRWCSETYEPGRKAISREQWATLQALAVAGARQSVRAAAPATEQPTMPQEPPPAAVPTSARSFSPSEQAAIDAAVAARRVKRIENGAWPGAARGELKKNPGWGWGKSS